ncbi:MAG: 4Fe-4S dicluster domain-containing protein [Roseobacter sp.]
MNFFKPSAFSTGDTHAELLPRPPGALPDMQFQDKCVGCGDCVAVCPGAALTLSPAGYPVLTHHRNCGMCGLCADVCSHAAIEFTDRTRAGFRIVLASEKMSDT